MLYSDSKKDQFVIHGIGSLLSYRHQFLLLIFYSIGGKDEEYEMCVFLVL